MGLNGLKVYRGISTIKRLGSSCHLSSRNVSSAAVHPSWIFIALLWHSSHCIDFTRTAANSYMLTSSYFGIDPYLQISWAETLWENECWNSPWVLVGAKFSICIHKSSLAYTTMGSVFHYSPEQLPLISIATTENYCVPVDWTQCMNQKPSNTVYLDGNSRFLTMNIEEIMVSFYTFLLKEKDGKLSWAICEFMFVKTGSTSKGPCGENELHLHSIIQTCRSKARWEKFSIMCC